MLRIIPFFVILMLFSSCKYLPNFPEENQPKLDTIIDFTKVDVSPSFQNCDEFIDERKMTCFRETMQKKIGKMLLSFSDSTSVSINEAVVLQLLIDEKGNTSVESVEIPEIVQKELPNLKNHIKDAVQDFPKLSPALKRGIPVSTQYTIPIHIKTD